MYIQMYNIFGINIYVYLHTCNFCTPKLNLVSSKQKKKKNEMQDNENIYEREWPKSITYESPSRGVYEIFRRLKVVLSKFSIMEIILEKGRGI